MKENKEDLNTISIEVNNMQIRKVIMNNGNEYELLWDIGRVKKDQYHLIDLHKGWVKINPKFISEEYSIGKLSDNTPLKPEIKKLILKYFGEDIFLE